MKGESKQEPGSGSGSGPGSMGPGQADGLFSILGLSPVSFQVIKILFFFQKNFNEAQRQLRNNNMNVNHNHLINYLSNAILYRINLINKYKNKSSNVNNSSNNTSHHSNPFNDIKNFFFSNTKIVNNNDVNTNPIHNVNPNYKSNYLDSLSSSSYGHPPSNPSSPQSSISSPFGFPSNVNSGVFGSGSSGSGSGSHFPFPFNFPFPLSSNSDNLYDHSDEANNSKSKSWNPPASSQAVALAIQMCKNDLILLYFHRAFIHHIDTNYHLSLEDSASIIELNHQSPLGYLRLGESLFFLHRHGELNDQNILNKLNSFMKLANLQPLNQNYTDSDKYYENINKYYFDYEPFKCPKEELDGYDLNFPEKEFEKNENERIAKFVKSQSLKFFFQNFYHFVHNLNRYKLVTQAQSSDNQYLVFDKLIKWLIQGQSHFPYLYLKYYSPEHRGVHAISNIPINKIVLEIPLTHIMTSEKAKQSEIGTKILLSNCQLTSSHSFLAAFLLQERHRPSSFWEPYISSLPKEYRNMPIFFTQQELSYLKGSFTLRKIQDRQEELSEEYKNICKAVPDFAQYSEKEFIWARLVVITRIFGLVIKGSKTDGLVPMADMLNHKRPRQTSWSFNDQRNSFIITTLNSINQDCQIYDSYGRKCNSRFFVNYGFALEDNVEDNQASFLFEISSVTDPMYHQKIRLLGNNINGMINGIYKRRFQFPCDYSETATLEAFSFLRFALSNDSDFITITHNEFNIKKIDPISIRNEVNVLSYIAERAKEQLELFATSLSEDLQTLADRSKLSDNIVNCLLMIKGEKQVLHYYIYLWAEIKPLVQLAWIQFKKACIKYYPGVNNYNHTHSNTNNSNKLCNGMNGSFFFKESISVIESSSSNQQEQENEKEKQKEKEFSSQPNNSSTTPNTNSSNNSNNPSHSNTLGSNRNVDNFAADYFREENEKNNFFESHHLFKFFRDRYITQVIIPLMTTQHCQERG